MEMRQPATTAKPAHNHTVASDPRLRNRIVIVVAAVAVALLVAGRLALPYAVKHLVNTRLERIPGYTGGVDDIEIHLWRGAYSLREFRILKKEGRLKEPFFRAKQIDFSIAWRELWHRKIVSDISVEEGQLIFVQGPTTEESQTDLDRRWQDVIQDIFPINITHLVVNHGLLSYRNTTRQPTVDVFVTDMHAIATGLQNRPRDAHGDEFPAHITIEGESLGKGRLSLSLAAEPLAQQPHFQLSLKLDDVNLTALNETLKAYANADVSAGTFRLVAEMAGREGGFQGYVKPFFEKLDFKSVEDKDKRVGARIWKRLVAAAAWIVKNKSRDQVATRIPFQGKFGDPKVGLFATIANLFRNGFVHAFDPTIEGSVRADNVLPDGSKKDDSAGENSAAKNKKEAGESRQR
jgi:hypothetical protein